MNINEIETMISTLQYPLSFLFLLSQIEINDLDLSIILRLFIKHYIG